MEQSATRLNAKRILGRLTPTAQKSLLLVTLCLLVSLAGAFLPTHEGLAPQGVMALFILLFCAGLWVTEAMPAFAVSLLAMGLEIALLGDVTHEGNGWEKYIATWGSPLIWLFFGGFILAAAAQKTGLDQWMATQVLSRLGNRPSNVLCGVMGSTAILSMFLSNTATATMMVAMLGPLIANNKDNPKLSTALLLGIAMAANIGGMGTLIGTPPNAIAAGVLAQGGGINFVEWMVYGIPPSLALLAIAWGYLALVYLGKSRFLPLESLTLSSERTPTSASPIQQALVVVCFGVTLLMWITSPLHGIPTTAVSFIPICVLTTTRVLDKDDVKNIAWDVLLLIAGGLSLGIAVNDTGLAIWIVAQLPIGGLSPIAIAVCLAFVATILSNLMSNTAAANVILPIAFVMLGTDHAELIIPIALAASAAMCLPISTPPNAIVYGTGKIRSRDLLGAGLLLGVLAPPVVVAWTVVVAKVGWVGG